jgi:hypothetical protein
MPFNKVPKGRVMISADRDPAPDAKLTTVPGAYVGFARD